MNLDVKEARVSRGFCELEHDESLVFIASSQLSALNFGPRNKTLDKLLSIREKSAPKLWQWLIISNRLDYSLGDFDIFFRDTISAQKFKEVACKLAPCSAAELLIAGWV